MQRGAVTAVQDSHGVGAHAVRQVKDMNGRFARSYASSWARTIGRAKEWMAVKDALQWFVMTEGLWTLGGAPCSQLICAASLLLKTDTTFQSLRIP